MRLQDAGLDIQVQAFARARTVLRRRGRASIVVVNGEEPSLERDAGLDICPGVRPSADCASTQGRAFFVAVNGEEPSLVLDTGLDIHVQAFARARTALQRSPQALALTPSGISGTG